MSFSPDKIRNIMIAGHNNAGKTTLAETLLYIAKASDRLGRVEDGNTIMDFDAEETKRQTSLSSALASLEYDGVKMNLIDTPGLFDFELGKYEGIMAAESVLITISARSGVTVGAQKAYRMAEKNNKARMIYVGKLDAEHAEFYKVFDALKAEFGASVCPVMVPHFTDDGANTVYVNLIENKAFTYAAGVASEVPVPDMGKRAAKFLAAMTEAVAETDEALMEKYFEGVPFTQEEMTEGVRIGVKTGTITPVFCGITPLQEGVDILLRYMKRLLPSAHRGGEITAVGKGGEDVALHCEPTEALAAYVFKTVADPFVGKLSYIKVLSGALKPDSPLVNSRTGESEKLGKLLFLKGKKQIDAPEISAGDIGALTKMANAKTGDTLCAPSRVVTIKAPAFPRPSFSMAIRVKKKGDEGKIAGALQRLVEEDGTLKYRVDSETLQQIISGLGEQHLDVVMAKLKSKFGVEVELEMPRVPYRETLRKKVKAQGRHKKQTGGHGQFGDVVIEFEPVESEQMLFEEKVFGGSVPKNFFPAVEKGLREASRQGVLAGYPVVNLKATLLEGSYHPVDSSEMAFRMAARLAYRAALPDASPVLLEPIGLLKAFVPESNTGDLMGEANKRRGRVMGMSPYEAGMQCVEAEIPMSEMHDFTTYMRQLTQGRGHFEFEFARYEPLPTNLEGKVIEEAKKIFVNKGEDE